VQATRDELVDAAGELVHKTGHVGEEHHVEPAVFQGPREIDPQVQVVHAGLLGFG
jgi:hypothetical protein